MHKILALIWENRNWFLEGLGVAILAAVVAMLGALARILLRWWADKPPTSSIDDDEAEPSAASVRPRSRKRQAGATPRTKKRGPRIGGRAKRNRR